MFGLVQHFFFFSLFSSLDDSQEFSDIESATKETCGLNSRFVCLYSGQWPMSVPTTQQIRSVIVSAMEKKKYIFLRTESLHAIVQFVAVYSLL